MRLHLQPTDLNASRDSDHQHDLRCCLLHNRQISDPEPRAAGVGPPTHMHEFRLVKVGWGRLFGLLTPLVSMAYVHLLTGRDRCLHIRNGNIPNSCLDTC